MNYQECIDFLYSRLPMFQNLGKVAYKKDLTNTLKLLAHLENPHLNMRFIHVGGTNGKGSVSSMLAAILTQSGYKTGLYTSPHLLNFTERIRVNGFEISQDFVIQFVKKMRTAIEDIQPSFFELTVAMCFDYFRDQKIDVGVIEVGLGGRLDSTNVITPVLSVITSIGWDHMDMLGDTLEAIAFEKAGIIKPNIPIACSRSIASSALDVIKNKALAEKAPFHLGEPTNSAFLSALQLKGSYQEENLNTVMQSVHVLNEYGFNIDPQIARMALGKVRELTGLRGRWEILQLNPVILCDTGHNAEAVPFLMSQLELEYPDQTKHIIWGMVGDKDRNRILKLLPQNAHYYTVKPGVIRGFNAELLQQEMQNQGFNNCQSYPDFESAIIAAHSAAVRDSGMLFIGGSTFLVADALAHFESK